MKTVYERISKLKELIKVSIGEFSDRGLFVAVDHVCREQDKSRKTLSEKERLLKDVLLRHNYKPKTVHSWLRVLSFPRFLQEQIKSGKVSYHEAKKLFQEYRIKTDKVVEQELLSDIRSYVDKLSEFIGGLDNVRRQF